MPGLIFLVGSFGGWRFGLKLVASSTASSTDSSDTSPSSGSSSDFPSALFFSSLALAVVYFSISSGFGIASWAFSASSTWWRSFLTSMIGFSSGISSGVSSITPRRSAWNPRILSMISFSCLRKSPSGMRKPAAWPWPPPPNISAMADALTAGFVVRIEPEIVLSARSFSKRTTSAPGALVINSSMISPVSSSLLSVSLKSSLDTVDQTIL